jgi:tartrate-resistant acid phosphatase type 5
VHRLQKIDSLLMKRFDGVLLMLRICLLLFSAGIPFVTCQHADSTGPTTSTLALPNGLNFLVLGDWGFLGQLHQQPVANQMEYYAREVNAKFIVSTGDNFYQNGVSSVQDFQWQESFERVYTGSHLQIPFKVVLGNHDYEQIGSAQYEVDYTYRSSRWQMPAPYFTEVVPIDATTSLRLVYIDTNPFVEEYRKHPAAYPGLLQQDTGRQLAWLDSVLAHAPERWKIVVGHHPIRSVGTDHADQPELVAQLQPLLTKYGVQVYLCGHSHTLQHLTTGGATDYVVSGGGGAPLGGVTLNPPARFAVAEGGFALLSVNADSLRVNFINASGIKLYQMQRGK